MPALNIVVPGGVATAKRQFWWISSQVAFFAKAQKAGDGQAKSAMQLEMKERRSCYRLGQAVEGQLQSIGHSIADWLPGKRYCRPLSPDEVRYKAPLKHTVDDTLPPLVLSTSFSYAVKNIETGAKRYELPLHPPSSLPIWCPVSDSCSENMGLAGYLEDELNLEIQWLWDQFHRCPNDCDLAYDRSGYRALRKSLKQLLTMPHGPWKSCTFFKQLQESWQSRLDRRSFVADETWLALGPDIAEEKGLDVDAVLNGEARALHALSCSRSLLGTGAFVKDRIWFSFLQRLDEFMPDWSLTQANCIHNGFELEVWKSPLELPLWPDRDGHYSAFTAPVSGSSKDDIARGKLQNSLHVAAHTLAPRQSKYRAYHMLELTRPVWTGYTKETLGCTGEDETLKYLLAYASVAFSSVLRKVWGVTQKQDKLRLMGLFPSCDHIASSASGCIVKEAEGLGVLETPLPDEVSAQFAEEKILARDAWKLQVRLVASRGMSTLQFTDSFP